MDDLKKQIRTVTAKLDRAQQLGDRASAEQWRHRLVELKREQKKWK